MSFFSGSPSFRKFYVKQIPKKVEEPDFLQRIKRNGFRPLTALEEISLGWVSIVNLLDYQLSYEKIFKDRFIVLGLRIDKRKVPVLLYKAHLDLEKRALLKVKGKERLTQEEDKKLKETVREKCQKQFPPSSSLYELIWDFKKKAVYFSGTGNSVCMEMTKMFLSTFEIEIAPKDPLGLIALNQEQQKSLKQLAPACFTTKEIDSPQTDKEFLGSEFLTWLWYMSEEKSSFKLESGESYSLAIYDNLQLIPNSGEEKVTVNGITGNAREASVALNQGKKLSSVKILVTQGEEEWLFTFNGKTFDFKSVKTPPIEEAEEVDRFIARMYHLEHISNLIEELYQQFLTSRLSQNWEKKDLQQIKKWVLKRIQ